MKASPTKTLRAVGVAAALAFAAGVASAGDATIAISSFTAAAEEFSGLYVWTVDPYQNYTMSALEGGGLYGSDSDSYSADDWNLGLNRVAQTSNAMATGNTVQFTDVSTQLLTAGFNLAAHASPGPYPDTTPPTYANASGLQAGSFTLIDENGTAAAGTITFDLYYDLGVSDMTANGLMNYGQTALSLNLSSDNTPGVSFDDGLLSSDFVSGVGATSGHFTLTLTLAAGEYASYTLTGNAIAQAVPEPGTWALTLVGLLSVTPLVRRRRAAALARA